MGVLISDKSFAAIITEVFFDATLYYLFMNWFKEADWSLLNCETGHF
jgi:hypothetical protein